MSPVEPHRKSNLGSLISILTNATDSKKPNAIQDISSANVNLLRVLGLILSMIAVQSILHLVVRLCSDLGVALENVTTGVLLLVENDNQQI